ncbi:MAG TPA: D-tagatose-bisphosphate aldolase, class II, non-catalytic subunit [Steroidobacteraceae bacterium]|jgi:D-tagatose-1,6-bisphosphate aldolase subunit GatZ/KbaZ|nr:D-tagatose-bisphosphate aldolase, class II, non-catalytic subunit [Steroidobacteraceae bacterium]
MLLDLVRRHRAGEVLGVASVCSAHPLVLAATLQHAHAQGGHALIEATSNQVNQDGGYTGWRPAAFRDLVWAMAEEIGLQRERVLLGGDHLGPNCWQTQPAPAALERAATLVREYVTAGFRKIHLDCSMSCGGDPHALADDVIAERTATLCAEAEDAWRRVGGDAPVYVIGSEVPTPGGAQETLETLAVTEPQDARATIAAHHTAFLAHGLEAAWERVIGLVVQPGVEFDHDAVIGYVPEKARLLSGSIANEPHLVFEAHSTDYQSETALAALVRDHFAILKVGPALTFALREAVWALDGIEREWLGEERSSRVRSTVLAAMRADPRHWSKYYHSEGRELEHQLEYSLSDRIRYYWHVPEVVEALSRLEATFNSGAPPPALLRQFLPDAWDAVRRGETQVSLQSLVIHHIREVLSQYSRACDQRADKIRGVSR